MKKTSVLRASRSRLSLNTVEALREYKTREIMFANDNDISINCVGVLVSVCYYYTKYGRGCTGYWLLGVIGNYSGASYNVLYGQLDLLYRKGFVECLKNSDNRNVYTPTDYAEVCLNDLLH